MKNFILYLMLVLSIGLITFHVGAFILSLVDALSFYEGFWHKYRVFGKISHDFLPVLMVYFLVIISLQLNRSK